MPKLRTPRTLIGLLVLLQTSFVASAQVPLAPLQAAPLQPAPFQAAPQQTAPIQPAPSTPAAPSVSAHASTILHDKSVRVKDIAFVAGDRVNHVSGVGLVVGLSGTGGRAEQTRFVASNMLQRQGIPVQNVNTQSMSFVTVSGKIPSFARKGETILVTVSVADDSSSLRGGTLHQTVLRGLDNEIYAIAHGAIIAGGLAAGGDAANIQANHPTVGVCEALVEREIACDRIIQNGRIRWVLRNKSYETATLVANSFNTIFPRHASALDAGTIEVIIPRSFHHKVPAFVSMLGDRRVEPDLPAKVVINQKTGTVVFGQNVKISRVVFGSENIVITTQENPVASQPQPFSGGQTAVLPRTTIDIFQSDGNYQALPSGLTVGDLATALNALGVSPHTLITILTSLRTQGALQAELIIE